LVKPGEGYRDPPQSAAALPCMRGAHCHHKCAPFANQMATLEMPRYAVVLLCVRGAHFHYERTPLSEQMATLGVWRCSRACPVLIFILNVRQSHTKWPPWVRCGMWRRSCACAVFIFSFPGFPRLLLASLLLASLSAIYVNSRSQENKLFGVLGWNHPDRPSKCTLPYIRFHGQHAYFYVDFDGRNYGNFQQAAP
jgi:hypothetical protein